MPPAIVAVARRYYGGVAKLRSIKVRGDIKWRSDRNRKSAWLKATAPFQLNRRP